MTSPVLVPAGHALVAADFDAYENLTGAWSTWSPTLTNLTLGSGTVLARYRQVGKTMDLRFKFTLGAGSAVGTNPTFTLPATVHASYATDDLFAYGQALDAGINTFQVSCFFNSTTVVRFVVSATTPFTFGSGDSLFVMANSIELA